MLFRRGRGLQERVGASVARSSAGAVVKIGSREFSMTSKEIARGAEIADFALYGLAAIGMSHGVEIDFDAPVTESALAHVNELGEMWELWSTRLPRRIHPLRLHVSNVVTNPSASGSGSGLLCMSGGVDSTYAGITASKRLNLTAGMLIAGADYPSEDDPRFLALSARVGRLSERIGLDLFTVATDIQRLKIEYRMFHPLLLAMCLHYASDRFSRGAFASDFCGAQEFHVHPWGNNSLVAAKLGSERFPVFHVGADVRRTEKVRAIAQHENGLIPHLSVCSADISSSGNCGVCAKCVRTKLSLMSLGCDHSAGFADGASPLQLLDQVPIERSTLKLLRTEVFLMEIIGDLRDEAAREVVRRYLERVRRSHRQRPAERRRLSFG